MFHATNFTESSTAFETLEQLMRAATGVQTFLRKYEDQSQDDLIVKMAHKAYLTRTDKVWDELPAEGFVDTQHASLWAMFANRSQWLARWGALAFPRIQMSHSFAAMLMATTVSRKEIPAIEAPWPAFMVEVPEGLLPIASKDETLTSITRIYVNTSFLPSIWSEPWWGLEMAGKGIEIHRIGRIEEAFDLRKKATLDDVPLLQLPEEFRTPPQDLPIGDPEDFWTGYDRSQEDRVAILAARLVLGACIMMTDRANVKEKTVKVAAEIAHHRRRFGQEPNSQVYIIGRPVKVDFRLAVSAFVHGKSKSLSVQSLVAGHHKHQPHGPGNSLRKWIFIEPYWRGDEEAPIVVRPHVGEGLV